MYAWNSISKAGFRASMPKSIARELREQARREGEMAHNQRLQVAGSKPAMSTSPTPGQLPKGCYCQLGSVFRAALFLSLILGVTAGVCYWIYLAHFAPDAKNFKNSDKNLTETEEDQKLRNSYNEWKAFTELSKKQESATLKNESGNDQFPKTVGQSSRQGKSMLNMEVKFVQEGGILSDLAASSDWLRAIPAAVSRSNGSLEEKVLQDKTLDVYTDVNGNLHSISELKVCCHMTFSRNCKLVHTAESRRPNKYKTERRNY